MMTKNEMIKKYYAVKNDYLDGIDVDKKAAEWLAEDEDNAEKMDELWWDNEDLVEHLAMDMAFYMLKLELTTEEEWETFSEVVDTLEMQGEDRCDYGL